MSATCSQHPRIKAALATAFAAALAFATQLYATPPESKSTSQPAQPRYHVTELRFPDSPVDHGATVDPSVFPNGPKFAPVLCEPSGISENDCITGTLVASDSKNHLFFYQNSHISDIYSRPEASELDSVISNDGIVIARIDLHPPGKRGRFDRLIMYKDGKISDITPSGDCEPMHVSRPNGRGEFLVMLSIMPPSPPYLLCSTNSPTQKPSHTGLFAGPNIEVGFGMQMRNNHKEMAAYALKDGVRFWFPQSSAGGLLPGNESAPYAAGGTNDAGDFVFTLGRRSYLANALTHKSSEILIPPSHTPPEIHMKQLCVDDQGVVRGTFADPTEFPFVYQDGKSTLLSDIVPHAASILFCTHAGTIVGMLDNHHLYLYDHGKTIDFGPINGNVARTAVNDFNQVLLSVSAKPPFKKQSVYLATASRLIDLNTFLPANADYEFDQGYFINDHGVIVATSEFNYPNGERRVLRRAFVLTPEVPNSTPAPSHMAETAPATRP